MKGLKVSEGGQRCSEDAKTLLFGFYRSSGSTGAGIYGSGKVAEAIDDRVSSIKNAFCVGVKTLFVEIVCDDSAQSLRQSD